MESGSITGAAGLLNISQPSVSRLVSDLELSVGFPLFNRVGRGLVATPEARRFYQSVEGMFTGIERLRELADTIRTTAGGVVTIGCIQSLSHALLPRAIRQFIEGSVDVELMVYVRNTPAIVEAVRMQQFDLGLVGRSPPYRGVEVLHETSANYVCLLPETHARVPDPGPLDLVELAQTETFITFGGAYPDEMLDLDHDLSAQLRARSNLSAANTSVMASLARETNSLALVDPYTADAACRMGGLIWRPLQQNLRYRVAVVTRGRDTLSREGRKLADQIIAEFQRTSNV